MIKFKKTLTKIAVMLIFLANVENGLINSALGEITKAFPTANPSLVSLTSTLPTVVMFFMSFIVVRIVDKYDKKTIVLVGLSIYAIGGVGAFFLSSNIYLLLFTRFLCGIGAGLATPLSGTIIAELYTGNEKATIFGLTNGVASIIGTLLTMLGGMLMMIDWNYIFLAYSVFFAIIALIIYALPSMPPVSAPKMIQDEAKKAAVKLTGSQIAILSLVVVLVYLNTLAGMIGPLNQAIYITQNNIGTPLFVATAFSINSIVTIFSSLVYGFLNRLLKRFVIVFSCVFTLVSYVIFLASPTIIGVVVANVFAGIALGQFMPAIQMLASTVLGEQYSAKSISVVFGAMFLAQFSSGFVSTFMGLFGNATAQGAFIMGIVLSVIMIIAFTVYFILSPVKQEAVKNSKYSV